MGVYRQQRDYNPDAGHRRKDGKEQGTEYLFVEFVHSAFTGSFPPSSPCYTRQAHPPDA